VRRSFEGDSMIRPDISSDLLIIPAFMNGAGHKPLFLRECAGGVVLERLLEQVLPIARDLRLKPMGFGDNIATSDLFRKHGFQFIRMNAAHLRGGQRLLPPATQVIVEDWAEGRIKHGSMMVLSPHVVFHTPDVLSRAYHDFHAKHERPTFSMTLEREPIYNLNDQQGPFSIEALWHYDAEAGRMFNRLSGKHFYRRQDAPPVYRADRVISILKPADVHRFDILVDQGKANPFMADGSSYVVLTQVTDIIRCEVMAGFHTERGEFDACRHPST
jgi:hypothetical protein